MQTSLRAVLWSLLLTLLPALASAQVVPADLCSVAFANDSVIVIAGNDGYWARSTDTGASWLVKKVPGYRLREVQFDGNAGLFCDDSSLALWLTEDAGASWNRSSIKAKHALRFGSDTLVYSNDDYIKVKTPARDTIYFVKSDKVYGGFCEDYHYQGTVIEELFRVGQSIYAPALAVFWCYDNGWPLELADEYMLVSSNIVAGASTWRGDDYTLGGLSASPSGLLLSLGSVWYRKHVRLGVVGIVTRDGAYQFRKDRINLNQAVCLNDSEYVAVADRGHIYRTTDSAVTWTLTDSVTSVNLHSIAYRAGEMVAVGDSGVVLISRDRGLHWSRPAGSITYEAVEREQAKRQAQCEIVSGELRVVGESLRAADLIDLTGRPIKLLPTSTGISLPTDVAAGVYVISYSTESTSRSVKVNFQNNHWYLAQ